jgi:hypothetical protein
MVHCACNADGLPIYDQHAPPRVCIINSAGVVADQDGVFIALNADGDPVDPTDGRTLLPQPATRVRIKFLAERYAAAALAGFVTTAPAGAVVVPTTIALTPARISRNPIDYGTKTGATLWDRAIKTIYGDPKNFYNLDPGTLLNFLDAIDRRAKECGWDLFAIVHTAATATTPVIHKNLLTEYGDLTIEQVKAHATTLRGTLTRSTQEDSQLFSCLNNSLSNEAINVLNLKSDDFKIADEFSGICYL